MTKVIIHGCNGKMGQKLTELCLQDKDIEIVAGIDVNRVPNDHYPVFKHVFDLMAYFRPTADENDVIIDFSSAAATDRLMEYCLETRTPLVLCTTGLSPEQLLRVEALAEEVPVLRSANMSLGINLIASLLRTAAPVLAQAGFDVEIVEKHHNLKKDAPSGTAVMLADIIRDATNISYNYTTDRSQVSAARGKCELGISSIRGGTIVGDHDIIFAGTDEVITLSHSAYSKAVFAKGAIEAVKWLVKVQKPALYNMNDVLAGKGVNPAPTPSTNLPFKIAKKNYDVTVQKIGTAIIRKGGFRHKATFSKEGMCTVAAESPEEAMMLINRLPALELDCMIQWTIDSTELVEAYCIDESFAPVDSMKALKNIDLGSVEIDWDGGITAVGVDTELDV